MKNISDCLCEQRGSHPASLYFALCAFLRNSLMKGYTVYVLIGAFNDGKCIVPVKLEIKEFNDKENVLYVAVALEKVKATEVSGQGNTNNGVTQNSRSVANISLAQLFRRINPNDKEFAKYIPDEILVTHGCYQ